MKLCRDGDIESIHSKMPLISRAIKQEKWGEPWRNILIRNYVLMINEIPEMA